MIKAISYSRYSPRPNAAECESVEHQQQEIRGHCSSKRYELAGEFSDKALSGGSDDRPGLEEAIAALKRGYVLVVTQMDRLARGNGLTEAILLKIAGKGASVESCDGTATRHETKDMRLLRGIKQVLAEYARDSTRELTSQRMKLHQQNGRRMSERLPYGWAEDPNSPTGPKGQYTGMVVNQEEQEVIRYMRKLRGEGLGGATLQEICTTLTSRGTTCRGRRWQPETVRRILARVNGGNSSPALASTALEPSQPTP